MTPEEQDRAELLRQATVIANIDIEELMGKTSLGTELAFDSAKPLFARLTAVFQRLSQTDLSLASDDKIGGLRVLAGRALNIIDSVKLFSPKKFSNPLQSQNQIISQLRELVNECFDAIAFVVAYNKPTAQDAEAARLLTALQDNVYMAEQARIQTQSTLESTKRAAQQVGIVQHAKFFQEESTEHNKAANLWLITTILLTLTAFLVGWWNYQHTVQMLTTAIQPTTQGRPQDLTKTNSVEQPPSNTALQVQLAVARLIIFSLLFSAVVWTGKMYRAHRHNFVINRHRLNALSTFEAFAKATEDQQIKNAVLLQATQCIFGPQATGYITSDSESDASPQILEIVRGFGGGDKAK